MAICCVGPAYAQTRNPSLNGRYIATAYSQTGVTKSGLYTHDHVIAADPVILPVGSRIKIRGAGRYSGEYVVADTGEKIVGRKLDIYIPNTRECMRFGKKRVRVKVIELGDGTHEGTKQADEAVKQDVKQDVSKGVVGNAATEGDWVKQGAPVAATAAASAGSAPAGTAKPAAPSTSATTGNSPASSSPPR
jgi:3D (Asp-Asp-Asp) domain-containing protein